MENIFYVYVYLDTRCPGIYFYKDFTFSYKPFYVGKGKGKRWLDHIRFAKTTDSSNHKLNTIRKIIEETGKNPLIIKVVENMPNEYALALEKDLIDHFGKAFDNSGILTNVIPGGMSNPILFGSQNGFYGKKHSDDSKIKMVAGYKKWFDSLPVDEKLMLNQKRSKSCKKAFGEKSKEQKAEIRRRAILTRNPHYYEEKEASRKAKEIVKLEMEIKRNSKKKKLKELSSEEYQGWLNKNRIGANNPNFDNGQKVAHERNGRAKILRIEINEFIFIVHGKLKDFAKTFKEFFKCSCPISSAGFQQRYNVSILEIMQDGIPENSITYHDVTSFEGLKNATFKKCKSKKS